MDYWHFTYDINNYSIKYASSFADKIENLNESPLIIANYLSKEELDEFITNYRGIICLIGSFDYIAQVLTRYSTQKLQIFAVRIDRTKNSLKHTHFLILNLTTKNVYYQEVLENYAICPACQQTTKDYGGKKHHYHSEGTWIRDVWNRKAFTTPLIKNAEFLQTIANLCAIASHKEIFVLNREIPEEFTLIEKFDELNTPLNNNNGDCEKLNQFTRYGQKIINEDSNIALDCLSNQNSTFDLIFSDPPYNLGKKYSVYKDSKSESEYHHWILSLYQKAILLLNNHGLFIILNTPYNNLKQYLYLKKWLNFIGEIVWDDLGVPTVGKIQATYYSILIFAKGTVNLERFLPPLEESIYCKRPSCVKKRIPKLLTNETIWSDIFRSRQKKQRWEHPCSLPLAFMERIIKMAQKSFGREDISILDFFNGIGTTTMASLKLKAKSVGVEFDPKYFEICKMRLSHMLFENPKSNSKNESKLGRTKKEIQLVVAGIIESTPQLSNQPIKDKVNWLILNKIISSNELKKFHNYSQLFRTVGKDGVLGMAKKEKETKSNSKNMDLNSFLKKI